MTEEPTNIQGNSSNSMTKETIRDLCKKQKLYVTPALNDVLYLHYQGFHEIECLEEYTGLKCIWLNCNAIGRISGLDNQKELRCLFLQNNFIKKIENLEICSQLDTLNLSHNYIKMIEQCDSMILPVLNTLNLSHNTLSSIDTLKELVNCKAVSILDLSHNRIDDILVVKIFAQMPELRVLTLTGNPVINEIPAYRKSLITECKKLTYLDSRPVFERDRACAEAWKRGGFEEEQKEHVKWIKAKEKKILNCVRATLRLQGRKRDECEFDSDVENDDEDGNSLQNIEIKHSNQSPGVNCTILDGNFSGVKHANVEKYLKKEMKMCCTNLLPTESAMDANETAVVKKSLEVAIESSIHNLAIQSKSTADNKPLIEVISEEESNANAEDIDIEFADHSAINPVTKKNSSIIFHCENLKSLKFLNIDADDSSENYSM